MQFVYRYRHLVRSAIVLGVLLFWAAIGSALVRPAKAVDLTHVLANAEAYAPPPCNSRVCVLTGPGGLVNLWIAHVDRHAAKGRTFVVKGVCASACRLAALRVHARLLPGARLVYHKPTTW